MADTTPEARKMLDGFLKKEVYVVVTRPVRSPEIAKKIIDHLDSQVRLEREGTMFAAGPMFEEGSDEPVAGMFVIRANSYAEARKIADSDPLHAAGLRSYTLRKWHINEGQFQVKINFSDQKAEIG